MTDEFTDMINQGGEAFLIMFLVVGAIGMSVVMFLASPKKFLKSLLKDLWNSLSESAEVRDNTTKDDR